MRGRQVGEHRHAVLLERGHDLAHPADARLCVHRCAVEELCERRKRFDTRRVREEGELTVVRATLQTLVALAALRRSCDDDAISNLHSFDHRPDSLDHTEAAVVRDLRAFDRSGAERTTYDGVAGSHSGRADNDLSRVDRPQAHLLNIKRAVVANQPAECPPCLCAGEYRWRLLRREPGSTCQQCGAAAECCGSRLQDTTARKTAFVVPGAHVPSWSRVFYNPCARR